MKGKYTHHSFARSPKKPRKGWAVAFKKMATSIADDASTVEEKSFRKAVKEGLRDLRKSRTLSVAKAKAKLGLK